MSNKRHYRNCLKSIKSISSKHLLVIIVITVVLWLCLLLYVCNRSKLNDDQIKDEILELSKRYVYVLASQQKNDVDGPYSGRLTGYDLKKTFAVLLQNIFERLTTLENRVANLTIINKQLTNSSADVHVNSDNSNNSHYQMLRNTLDSNNRLDFSDIIKGAQEKCILDLDSKLRFPECDDKITWMNKHWQSHKCYSENGVDGSMCSIIIYLSEVEQYCPKLKFREQNNLSNISQTHTVAELNFNLTALLDKLDSNDNQDALVFMRMRIQKMWPRVVDAAIKLNKESTFQTRNVRTILLYMGFLSKASKLKFSDTTFTGGPLGELVQWSDLIVSLFILGHDITILSELADINTYLLQIPNFNVPCQTKLGNRLDILFTDIIGFNQIYNKFVKFKCRLRILDTFGTQPIYNNPFFLKKNNIKINGWRGKLLELKQFYNMYPHTDDNTFLGFIVPSPQYVPKKKKKIALVYGKHLSMWKNAESYLNIIKEYFDVHATVSGPFNDKVKLPDYVINHGVLFDANYTALLDQAMVFIGLGFPYEGPAPLEGIARGAVFLNPKFDAKQIKAATLFFEEKPTKRKLFSQHPYIEQNIGEPFSYLIDISNETYIREVCKKISKRKLFRSFVPFEFTETGFLQRIAVLTEKQMFCQQPTAYDFEEDIDQWPNLRSAHFFLGIVNESCEATCHKQNLICEASYIERMMNNRLELQQRGVWCESVKYSPHPAHPSYDPYQKTCFFQTDHFLYSCIDSMENHMRFCGCRDSIIGQSALCTSCL